MPSISADARGQSCKTAYFFPITKVTHEPAGILYVLKASGEMYALRCSRDVMNSSAASIASLREVMIGGMTRIVVQDQVDATEFWKPSTFRHKAELPLQARLKK
jgi:hypothetical protein